MEWARLIPGEIPQAKPDKKPPASVRPFLLEKDADADSSAPQPRGRRETILELWLPRPLLSRAADKWALSMVVDFALVALNWMLLGILGAPLGTSVPHSPEGSENVGAAISWMGIAVLQGALITLLAYSEGLQAEGLSVRGQARILGKSVVGATGILLFGYFVQGASWKVIVLFSITGLLNFFSLWLWRWNRAGRDRMKVETRNVLIVGAGPVGRSVCAWVEQNRAAGQRVCR
jgi:FlaA1/EpsC-like NDP-sugar epimerase